MTQSEVAAGGGPNRAATSASKLVADGLQKSFSGRVVLQPFRLEIRAGEIHALLGQNGSGKSTFIKILSGLNKPDVPATCLIAGEQLTFTDAASSHALGIRFVHQELGLIDTESILDNLSYLDGYETSIGTIRQREAMARAARALEVVGLDLDPRTPVGELSAAQRTGVAVARAIGLDAGSANLLVLDEPTATLPEAEVEHLHAMVRAAAAQGVGILYVTHHLDEVYRLADSVSVLRDGYRVLSGLVSATQQRDIVQALVGTELESVKRDRQDSAREPDEQPILSVRGVVAHSLDNVSFDVFPGEIVGVSGVTGSGRESILGAIFGSVNRYDGEVLIDGRTLPALSPSAATAARIGYLPPDRKVSGAFLTLSAAENITIADLGSVWRRGWLRLKEEAAQARDWFARLSVRPAGAVNESFGTFSGGNQQKILFAKWLRTSPQVLLLDEPTQGVDVGAKAEIHRQIISASQSGMATVVSSTDIEELAALCDRILLMAGGQIVDEMTGGGFTPTQINRRTHEATIR